MIFAVALRIAVDILVFDIGAVRRFGEQTCTVLVTGRGGGRTGCIMVETGLDISASQRPMRGIERLPVARDRPILGSAMTLVIVAAACILRMVANPVLPSGYPYLAFFPAVIVTSFLFGARLGTVAAEG